jgi:hypothetical protein
MTADILPMPPRQPLSPLPFVQTAKALVVALGIVRAYDVPEQVHVHVHGEGQNVTLDLTHCHKPATAMAHLGAAMGLDMGEYPSETPDGCAAVELRFQQYDDGILLTVRAVVAVPATWPKS